MGPRWFVDESALGLGKLLARLPSDVVYTGHPEVPEIPLGTADVTWMPLVAERHWIAIRRDRRIHTRPSEVRVFTEVGLRTVWLGGKKDMSSTQQLDLVTRHWPALERRQEDLGPRTLEHHASRRRAVGTHLTAGALTRTTESPCATAREWHCECAACGRPAEPLTAQVSYL